MAHRLLPSFFHEKYLAILGLTAVSLLSFGLSQSFAQTTITLDTTRNSYGPGDLIEVKGQVMDFPNKLVAVQVKDPSGNTIMVRTIKTDGNGNFVIQFKLPSTAIVGIYKITTNANIAGNVIAQTKQIAETPTVPEFSSMTPVVFVVAILSILVLSMKTRANLKI
ncbi:MAG: hypothetical protein KGH88_03540 [Thaumarchaeota archaeon]|nr:hypothetical protein [Nitrososphaerota archaeon]